MHKIAITKKCVLYRNALPKTLITVIIALGLSVAATHSQAAGPTAQEQHAEGQLDLSAWKGKVVYLDFWASWCGPCRQSFPWMISLQRRYADQGFVVVGVNVDKDRELANKFLDQFHASFPIIFDSTGHLAEQFKIPGMPSSVIFDRDGAVRFVHSGFRSEQTAVLESELKSLLQ